MKKVSLLALLAGTLLMAAPAWAQPAGETGAHAASGGWMFLQDKGAAYLARASVRGSC